MAGYSQRSLVEKLGIKPGYRIHIANPPAGYAQTLGPLPASVSQSQDLRGPLDFIQLFAKERRVLVAALPSLKAALAQTGMLWVSWPKMASKVPTDLSENVVREIALSHGLVDVKVCYVDETWSGLKLVYRLKDRKG
ncbi:MAG: DUF3052 family protein [Dehalococcoidia bacterium]|nr:DUF3052 family protein [Dehalococcoidia bacterium]